MLYIKVKNAILESLGLEEDEEFEIKGIDYKYRINENGLEIKEEEIMNSKFSSYNWEHEIDYTLDDLLLGKLKIFKLPFVPRKNQTYYYPIISNAYLYRKTYNDGTDHDKYRIKHELCFKTKEGAIVKAKKILELLRGGE